MKKLLLFKLLLVISIIIIVADLHADSGGPLSPEQAAYDVNYYELDLSIFPDAKRIAGSLLCRVEILDPIDTLVLDLDNPFQVDSTTAKINGGTFSLVEFNHTQGKLYINIPGSVTTGDMLTVQVYYNGAPRIANNPPWGVGFVWETTPTGKPWIGVACEDDGADIWWPCKDHPSDEPDSMLMHFTVPDPLICVSNGQYLGSVANGNNTTTFNWFISTPINNYNVSIYAAEFALIEDEYLSVSGETIPFYFAVLPEDSATAANYMDVFLSEFDFLESICGPFPFGTDKHGWAHAPYWGMEHQTIIAYGHNFTVNSWGFDYIHYHELAHEWWGNLITAGNWADIWIHEGIATYTEALFVEDFLGMDSYHQFMDSHRPANNHNNPLAPYEELTAAQGFSLNPYNRGASVMHTLRYHLTDEPFFNLLKRWAYPDSTDYDNTNGRLCRILTTEDLKDQAEEVTGRELDPFFDVFFREAAYPVLHVVRELDSAVFTWETENDVPLDLNIPIRVNGTDEIVEMNDGLGSFNITTGDELKIDPKKWILMDEPSIVVSVEDNIAQIADIKFDQNYPNPFSSTTKIRISISKPQILTLKVFDVYGNEMATLGNSAKNAGTHEFVFDGSHHPGGTYYLRLQTGNFIETKKMILIH